MKIAALFVEECGPYSEFSFIDVWGVSRDARNYSSSFPVIAHPPCERWGRYWSGGPNALGKYRLGEDGGCFSFALETVRRCGGVLEHPEASHAWEYFGLKRPQRKGGWQSAGDGVGVTCCVEQGRYGHPAKKATWLYSVGCFTPELSWGIGPPKIKAPVEESFKSSEERRNARAAGILPLKRLTRRERVETPRPFRDLLILMALSCER